MSVSTLLWGRIIHKIVIVLEFTLQSEMKHIKTPFREIRNDVRGRAACYKQDWIAGIRSGLGYFLFSHFVKITMKVWNFAGQYAKFNFLLFVLLHRILAPTTCIFFASALPVIAFGEQLSRDTGFGLHSCAVFALYCVCRTM